MSRSNKVGSVQSAGLREIAAAGGVSFFSGQEGRGEPFFLGGLCVSRPSADFVCQRFDGLDDGLEVFAVKVGIG